MGKYLEMIKNNQGSIVKGLLITGGVVIATLAGKAILKAISAEAEETDVEGQEIVDAFSEETE